MPNLDLLFKPRSIAVVGASRNPTRSGYRFVRDIVGGGFAGPVYPINPEAAEAGGLPAYPSLEAIGRPVDLAYIMLPARMVAAAVAECARYGVPFVIVHSVGFREAGEEGQRHNRDLLAAIAGTATRVVGPNCMGVCCPEAGLNTIVEPGPRPFEPGHVAYVGQSGWATENFLVTAADRGLGFSRVASVGNQADLTSVDYFDYFGSDADTRIGGAYIEGSVTGRALMATVAAVAPHKPLVLWKAGKQSAGARAVFSHTGSLAGDRRVWEAFARQAGALEADDVEAVVDIMVALAGAHLPCGRRIGILTQAGGGGAVIADHFEAAGLEAPVLPDEARERLRLLMQGRAITLAALRNPVDMVGVPHAHRYDMSAEAARIMLDYVDALVVFTYEELADTAMLDTMSELGHAFAKPIVFVPGLPAKMRGVMHVPVRRGLPSFPTGPRAARGLAAAARWNIEVRAGGPRPDGLGIIDVAPPPAAGG